MKALRPILPLHLPEAHRASLQSWKPELRWVAPTRLLVDEGYQRSLTERSVKLIARIVARWDWASFKPPVVVETNEGLHVLDGQHTAIAAATHGGLPEIPVFIVQAEMQERAKAFVAHNRDRVAMTQQALHHAMVAAGDEDAVTIEQVCARAGVKILKTPPWNAGYGVGESMAIGAIRALVRRRHAMGARKVLELLVLARLAPISADHIKAVELLMFADEYAGLDHDKLAATLMRMGAEALGEAAQLAAAKNWPRWKSLAIVLSKGARARAVA